MLAAVLLAVTLLTPSLPQAWAQQGDWFQQARAYLQRGNWQAARDLAQKALESNPQLANAEMLLGLAVLQLRDCLRCASGR